MDLTPLSPAGVHDSGSCGYCHDSKGTIKRSYYLNSAKGKLPPALYNDLMDRGFRRCGCFMYRPANDVTCCPQYSIRTPFLDFQQTKLQKAALRKFQRFFGQLPPVPKKKPKQGGKDVPGHFLELLFRTGDALPSALAFEKEKTVFKIQKREGLGHVFTNWPFVVASRLSRSPEDVAAELVSLLSFTAPLVSATVSSGGLVNFWFDADGKNALDASGKGALDASEEIAEAHTLRTDIVPAAYDDEGHAVYKAYQMAVHGDEESACDKKAYERFLCKSCLIHEPPQSEMDPPCGYGSFHQRYFCDDKLFAVGVLDILPRGMSSVYFFYDTRLKQLGMGRVGALLELEFGAEVARTNAAFRNYYLGFYVADCHKMRYKGEYQPAELLCHQTRRFVPFAEANALLHATGGKYTPFVKEMVEEEEEENSKMLWMLAPIRVFQASQPLQVISIQERLSEGLVKRLKEILEPYTQEVGASCLKIIAVLDGTDL